MLIRFLVGLIYFTYCTRYRVNPWDFYQLNSQYYNDEKELYSKLDMDQYVPRQWRLTQWQDLPSVTPKNFPVFMKPEWGQNSRGIYKADTEKEFLSIKSKINTDTSYLVQEAATGLHEFDIFFIPTAESKGRGVLTITQVKNRKNSTLPINGVLNPNTYYVDHTSTLSSKQREQLRSIAHHFPFNICKIAAMSDSMESLLNGDFKVIEVNIFVPFPLSLESENVSFLRKINFIFFTVKQIIPVIKNLPKNQVKKSIFLKQMNRLRKLM
jgi:hypothetical protein